MINKLKALQMVRFKTEFFEDFSGEIKILHQEKNYHYFEIYEGVMRKTKVVNKQSLREIYGYDCEDLFDFFRTNNELLPLLYGETEHFFLFEYIEGEPIRNITKEDFNYLEKFEGLEFYPFFNSLYTNLIRQEDGKIKLIDLKHLDNKVCNIPDYLKDNLIVFLYNKEDRISNLYIKNKKYIEEILNILEKDYDNIRIMEIEK